MQWGSTTASNATAFSTPTAFTPPFDHPSTSYWTEVRGINAAGHIVGAYTGADTNTKGFLYIDVARSVDATCLGLDAHDIEGGKRHV